MQVAFYAVFFIWLQGEPMLWDTRQSIGHFDTVEQCLEYTNPAIADIRLTVTLNDLGAGDGMIMEAWCVPEHVEEEKTI